MRVVNISFQTISDHLQFNTVKYMWNMLEFHGGSHNKLNERQPMKDKQISVKNNVVEHKNINQNYKHKRQHGLVTFHLY